MRCHGQGYPGNDEEEMRGEKGYPALKVCNGHSATQSVLLFTDGALQQMTRSDFNVNLTFTYSVGIHPKKPDVLRKKILPGAAL